MKCLILLVPLLLISLTGNSEELNSDDELPELITSTGLPDLSIGWEMIALRTELGDTIKIDSINENGKIVEVSIQGRNNIVIDSALFKDIRYPDLRTLNDIWYNYKLDKINYLKFEFNQYFDGTSFINGRFKVYLELEGDSVDVFVKVYDPVRQTWNSPNSN